MCATAKVLAHSPRSTYKDISPGDGQKMDQPTGSRISFLQPSGKGKTMGQSLPVDKSFNMARALISGWAPLEIIAVPISQPPEKNIWHSR